LDRCLSGTTVKFPLLHRPLFRGATNPVMRRNSTALYSRIDSSFLSNYMLAHALCSHSAGLSRQFDRVLRSRQIKVCESAGCLDTWGVNGIRMVACFSPHNVQILSSMVIICSAGAAILCLAEIDPYGNTSLDFCEALFGWMPKPHYARVRGIACDLLTTVGGASSLLEMSLSDRYPKHHVQSLRHACHDGFICASKCVVIFPICYRSPKQKRAEVIGTARAKGLRRCSQILYCDPNKVVAGSEI